MQCPTCRGKGCSKCKDGRIPIVGCPMSQVDRELWEQINLAGHAMQDKIFPNAGGLNDQPARFVAVWRLFKSDVNFIETEQAKRGKRR